MQKFSKITNKQLFYLNITPIFMKKVNVSRNICKLNLKKHYLQNVYFLQNIE